MRPLIVGLAFTLIAAACSGDATEPEPVVVATVDTVLPTPIVVPSATPIEGPAPTPTTRVISIPGTPSENALLCSRAGLVAAGLDACLQYEAAECFWFSDRAPCNGARDRLEAVHDTRVFPTDCALARDNGATLPTWCDVDADVEDQVGADDGDADDDPGADDGDVDDDRDGAQGDG